MSSEFNSAAEVRREEVPWGSLAWYSDPASTGAADLVAVAVTFSPGAGHAFHRHPNQEEFILVLEGRIEQWVGRKKRILGPGDSAFVGRDVVHASFNTGGQSARLLAVLGPSVGQAGYELVDVAGEEPWASIR